MGTNISVHLYMIATVTFFSLLHINFWVLTCLFLLLKVKCDHIHHVCTEGFAPTWWRWSRRVFSLLTAYQILSAEFILKIVLDNGAIVSYNTTTAEEAVSCSHCSAWPHSYHLLVWAWPHVAVDVFLLCSRRFSSLFPICFFSAGGAIFERFCRPENKTTYQSFGTRIWPHLWP